MQRTFTVDRGPDGTGKLGIRIYTLEDGFGCRIYRIDEGGAVAKAGVALVGDRLVVINGHSLDSRIYTPARRNIGIFGAHVILTRSTLHCR